MRPVEHFANQRDLGFECQVVYTRPDGLMQDLAFHYKCRITQGRRGFTLYFSQGSTHTSPPTLGDVLRCVCDDAAGYENAGSFEDWAGEYGYEVDSRSAEKIYRAVKRQAEQLKRVLGQDNYDYLVQDVMAADREEECAVDNGGVAR
jgi:hypothetical protein